ncbi:MAG: bacillithiol biosynthesis cysteine-adding enzyme BshC [Planctomycetes bacterium]|nr:bacillithiol biosynthesis cysteine-adding enzyme BshC [Planctomycetota bacterium]
MNAHPPQDAGSELGRRYVTDFTQVESFYAGDYRRIEHLALHANRLFSRTWAARFDRALTADLVQAYTDQHPAPQAVREAVARLRDPACVCVVTGQQAGLGGGPALALYKALTALRLARELEQAAGLPCVAVFWNASDDSDLEEVNRLRSVDGAGNLRKFRFPMQAGKRPVRDVALPGPEDPLWQQACEALGDGPWSARAQLLLRDSAGRDFGSAFTRLLHELLGPRGLVVIEPRALTSHPQWKRVLACELELRQEHRLGLQRAFDRLEALGLPPGVSPSTHLNLFALVEGERRHVTDEGRLLQVEGRPPAISRTALLKQLRAQPGLFTPSVLLRPVVQNAIFPTVAYVGGPSEIAYHGLLKGLHRSAQVFMPLLFPRLSLTVLDGTDAPRFDDLVAFRRQLGWRQGEAAVAAESARRGMEQAFAGLQDDLRTLARPLENDINRLQQRTQRAIGEVMNRIEHEPLRIFPGGDEYGPVLGKYFPENRPQERVVTVLALLARYGPRLLDAIDQHPDLFDFNHHVVVAS